ncbi:MAG: hypothetical protein RIS09_338 [Actinomycetota bacterium]|jgi:hypothetical protein
MTISISSLKNSSSSSTAATAEWLSCVLNTDINPASLRTTYQSHFQALLRLETSALHLPEIHEALNLFQQSFSTSSGNSPLQELQNVQEQSQALTFFEVRGSGEMQFIDFKNSANDWVKDYLAEPAIVEVLSKQRRPESILLALAAGAECAPTKAWLNAGGTVVALMRSNPERYQELIKHARASAGTLVIPVKGHIELAIRDELLAQKAGFDLVNDFKLIPEILSHSTKLGHTVIGAYAYSPGSSHLIVQVAQDAIVEYAAQTYSPAQVAFHWLATPTDSQALPIEFIESSIGRYKNRSNLQKIRDLFWQILGQLKKPRVQKLSEELVVIDSSVQKQGFNYQFAKRIQRLRAHTLVASGFKVAYSITPPASTDSVLSHRILIASYRGAPRFGLQPFDKNLIGPIAMQQCLASLSHEFAFGHSMYSHYAVHGGLWRLAYNPKTVWIAATVSGLLGLLLPRNRAFRTISLTN